MKASKVTINDIKRDSNTVKIMLARDTDQVESEPDYKVVSYNNQDKEKSNNDIKNKNSGINIIKSTIIEESEIEKQIIIKPKEDKSTEQPNLTDSNVVIMDGVSSKKGLEDGLFFI